MQVLPRGTAHPMRCILLSQPRVRSVTSQPPHLHLVSRTAQHQEVPETDESSGGEDEKDFWTCRQVLQWPSEHTRI